jgi:aryl-alcohol dehydrogenase-like predicted oxidoreductase
LRNRRLAALAEHDGATSAQLALAWLLTQPGVAAIPKAGSTAHVRENRLALGVNLPTARQAEIDRSFPPPKRATPLKMI